MDVICVEHVGKTWAIKHSGSYLGHAKSFQEATSIGQELVRWLESQGRPAELVAEPKVLAAQQADGGSK